MDFSLTDDQRLIRDTVRHFMDAEVRPSMRARDREEKFAAEELRKIGELGCCGMLVPESWGGAGADTISYVLMLEEVARVDAAMAVALSVTNSLAAWAVFKYGADAQREKYLRRLARGEILGAFCLTEPQAGSDAAAIGTRATRHGSIYRLSGTKSWVTNGGVSGLYVVFAKTDLSAGARGVTAFLVEPSFPGFRVARYEDKMGLRTSRSAEIAFTDCEVPESNRLGEEGQGLKIALELLDGGRVGIAAQAVGSRRARWKRQSSMPNSAAHLARPSETSRRYNGCSRICRPKLKRRARWSKMQRGFEIRVRRASAPRRRAQNSSREKW